MSKPIVNALLISAGLSSRMGNFKPLIKLENQTFVTTVAKKLLSVCKNVTVVTGYKSNELEKEIRYSFQNENGTLSPNVKCVFNPEYGSGMFSSVKTGLAEMKNSDWVIFHFVDQPMIPIGFYRELILQIDDSYDWIQPVYDLKQGHPVLFKNSVFPKILNAPTNYLMRLIREDEEVKKKYWVTDYKYILEDLDTQEDLLKISECNTV